MNGTQIENNQEYRKVNSTDILFYNWNEIEFWIYDRCVEVDGKIICGCYKPFLAWERKISEAWKERLLLNVLSDTVTDNWLYRHILVRILGSVSQITGDN